MSEEKITFFDKYGKYIVGLLAVYFAYAIYLQDKDSKSKISKTELYEILNREESSGFKYGYKLGTDMAKERVDYCYQYSGDVYNGCAVAIEVETDYDP